MKCHFNYFQAYIICICDSFLQLKVLIVVVKKSWVRDTSAKINIAILGFVRCGPQILHPITMYLTQHVSNCFQNEKGFILISVIQFWFSFMSIITLFMFILCEIQTQFSCYECDIFLFFQLPYYICTRKLIFSSTKIFLDWVKGKSFADLVCASLKPTQYIKMSNFTDNNFLFPLYACIFTQTNISWTKLGNGATWRALVNVNRSDATPTVFQIKYFPLTPVH